MFFSDKFKRTNSPKIDPKALMITNDDMAKAQRERAIRIMSMNRKQRRSLGKFNGGIKIPGIVRPYVKPSKELEATKDGMRTMTDSDVVKEKEK